MSLKICGHCNNVLDVSLFNKDNSSKDNLHRVCRDCSKAYRRKYAEKNGYVKKPINNLTKREKISRAFAEYQGI